MSNLSTFLTTVRALLAVSYKDLTMAVMSERWNPSPQMYQVMLDDMTKLCDLLDAAARVMTEIKRQHRCHDQQGFIRFTKAAATCLVCNELTAWQQVVDRRKHDG